MRPRRRERLDPPPRRGSHGSTAEGRDGDAEIRELLREFIAIRVLKILADATHELRSGGLNARHKLALGGSGQCLRGEQALLVIGQRFRLKDEQAQNRTAQRPLRVQIVKYVLDTHSGSSRGDNDSKSNGGQTVRRASREVKPPAGIRQRHCARGFLRG